MNRKRRKYAPTAAAWKPSEKPKAPHGGCLLLQQFRQHGLIIPGPSPAWKNAFDEARNHLIDRSIPSFWDPTVRLKDGEEMNFALMKPPYKVQWVELPSLITPGARLGFLVRLLPPKPSVGVVGEQVEIRSIGMSLTKPDLLVARAGVIFELDENGKGFKTRTLPTCNPDAPDISSHNTQVDFCYPCIRTIQVMNCLNVGFHEIRHPDETDERLGREARRRAIGLRYHVLTLRSHADIRAGRKVVDNPGSMPLNTARGHYVHYGDAAKHGHPDGRDRGMLFGQYSGRWWIEAYARGKAENGVVQKDYRMHHDVPVPVHAEAAHG